MRFTLGTYATPSARYLVVKVSNGGSLSVRDAEVKNIAVGGHHAKLIRYSQNARSPYIAWNQQGLDLAAYSPANDDLSLGDLLPFLRSIQ